MLECWVGGVRSGKSYYAVMQVMEYLRTTSMRVVTNLPLRPEVLQTVMGRKFDASRLLLLEDSKLREFWAHTREDDCIIIDEFYTVLGFADKPATAEARQLEAKRMESCVDRLCKSEHYGQHILLIGHDISYFPRNILQAAGQVVAIENTKFLPLFGDGTKGKNHIENWLRGCFDGLRVPWQAFQYEVLRPTYRNGRRRMVQISKMTIWPRKEIFNCYDSFSRPISEKAPPREYEDMQTAAARRTWIMWFREWLYGGFSNLLLTVLAVGLCVYFWPTIRAKARGMLFPSSGVVSSASGGQAAGVASTASGGQAAGVASTASGGQAAGVASTASAGQAAGVPLAPPVRASTVSASVGQAAGVSVLVEDLPASASPDIGPPLPPSPPSGYRAALGWAGDTAGYAWFPDPAAIPGEQRQHEIESLRVRWGLYGVRLSSSDALGLEWSIAGNVAATLAGVSDTLGVTVSPLASRIRQDLVSVAGGEWTIIPGQAYEWFEGSEDRVESGSTISGSDRVILQTNFRQVGLRVRLQARRAPSGWVVIARVTDNRASQASQIDGHFLLADAGGIPAPMTWQLGSQRVEEKGLPGVPILGGLLGSRRTVSERVVAFLCLVPVPAAVPVSSPPADLPEVPEW